MATISTTEAPEAERSTAVRVAEAVRKAAHASHEAGLLKTMAADAVEDGLYTARRTVKRATMRAIDARDALAYQVKRRPFAAVALAVGAGAVLGLVVGLVSRRRNDAA